VIDIDGNTLVERFIRETGEIQDSFTIIKDLPSSPVEFRIVSVGVQNGTLSLTWNSRPGGKYVVERATSLSGARWQAVTAQITAPGFTHTWTSAVDANAGASFYRVVAY
jgi:hypothetical protein